MLLFYYTQYMSQVIRKYDSGGKTEKPKLFSISGLGDFDQNALIERGYRDVDDYISKKGLKGSMASNFRNAVQYMLEGINNGTLTMDAMGNFQDKTGRASSTGELDRKKFLGIKTGIKDTDNNAYGIAADYLHGLVMSSPKYKQPEAPAAKPWNIETDLANAALGGNWSMESWNKLDYDPETKKWSTTNRQKYISQVLANRLKYLEENPEFDYNKDVFSSREDYLSRFRDAVGKLQDGSYDAQDYATFARLGLTDMDKYLKTDFSTQTETPAAPVVEGRTGRVDTGWSNPDYERTIDDKGVYHIYKKGSGEEVHGVIPGNVFNGVGNRYAFDGNIYDDSNLPEKYKKDIELARRAQLNDYTKLTGDNPFTKSLMDQGYGYITDLSSYASGLGENGTLYGAYHDPSDVNAKFGFYLKDPETGRMRSGQVRYNDTLGEYQFMGDDNNVVNLGAYNQGGSRTNAGTTFVNYNDTSAENLHNLMNAWINDPDLNNPASEAYKMVQNTLSKWIRSGNSPFKEQNGIFHWQEGDNFMNARMNKDGQWEWAFNDKFINPSSSSGATRRANARMSEKDMEQYRQLMSKYKQGTFFEPSLSPEERRIFADLRGKRMADLRSIPASTRTQEEKDELYYLGGFKEGGVITAQLGTKFTKVEDKPQVKEVELSEERKEKNKKVHQSFTGRSNVALWDNKDITDAGGVLKTSDKVRLGAAMADLASVGLGFVPGANIASTGIGIGSSLTEFGADWASDGLDWGDVGRLGMNLGMDALSLIPVGKTLKATKVLGKIKKSIPLIMTAINAANYLDPTIREEYGKTLSKLVKGNIGSLNTGDFKNLSAIASTVLGVKNVAQTTKGRWNTSTTPSGKRRVTAMINGKQQTLDVDDAFFQNTKGKNQVSELKAKFAEQYNKANNLEGDKAIKPENVAVDTKYFGRRPQSEKVAGTKNDGTWVSNTLLGKYFLGYVDPSKPRGNANIPFSDAWFYKNGWVGGRTRAEKQDIKNRWAESRKRAGQIREQQNKELTQKGVESITDIAQALNTAGKYRTQLALPAPGNTHRVFVMGDGKAKPTIQDKTDPSKLRRPSSYQDLAVPTGGTSVEAPSADAVRVVNTVNSILDPFIKTKNLPAVIPDSRNAEKIVASRTIQPSQRLDQFIESQIPGGRQFGRQRAKTEREYRDIFHPVAEREYNQVWDEAIRNRKDFGYEEVTPRRSIYAPPTPTEIYIVPEGAMKDPNARYLWELINSKSSTAHVKRDNLPHKSKNKKKKTSRDDRATKKEFGGILLREGGLIPKYQGGNVMQRGTKGSWLNNENTYKDATNLGAWDSYYDMNKIIDDINTSRLLAQQNADEFINTLNGLASQNLPWKKQLNARGYKNWNQLYKTTGFNKYFGEDEGRFDYLGPSTWNRRLFLQTLGSRYNSPENALSVGNDKIWYGDGTWKKVEKALSEPDAEEKVEIVTGQKQAETPATNATTGRRITLPDATSKKFSIHPEDALALGRMVGGLVTNNRAAKLYKEGLKPTLLDTFENYVPLQGNFQAKTSGEQQAGNIQSLAAMPRTSDASLQLAGELDATDRAAQARMQGDLADAERFYQTRMLGQQESDAAKARRVEVANKNRVAINAIDAAKKQIDAGRVTANYQQVLAPWLAGVENQFRQNRAMKNQLALETYQNRASSEYDLALAKILEDYKDDPVGRQKALNQLRSEASANLLKERSKLIDSPWLIQFGEKGTKLTYKEKAMLQRAKDFNKRLADDNKQFHKDIMESKREHNKLIMNMSALTAALIKKGMQL